MTITRWLFSTAVGARRRPRRCSAGRQLQHPALVRRRQAAVVRRLPGPRHRERDRADGDQLYRRPAQSRRRPARRRCCERPAQLVPEGAAASIGDRRHARHQPQRERHGRAASPGSGHRRSRAAQRRHAGRHPERAAGLRRLWRRRARSAAGTTSRAQDMHGKILVELVNDPDFEAAPASRSRASSAARR